MARRVILDTGTLIAIERGNFSFYFPIVTCVLISILLSAMFWLFNR